MQRPNNADADSHIGRRLKLRDLQILCSVAKFGSMAKAATHLSTTQPTVSQAIADLEDTLGVRLFDRSTKGVVPTVYGDILLKSALEAFDALKQGMRGIEFLATPGAGDVWIGCAEPTLHGFVPAVIERLAKLHPKIVVHAADANPAENQFLRLRDRSMDLMIGRSSRSHVDDDLHVENLFDESFCVVTASHNPWARRRKVELAELMDESWIFGEPGNTTQALISEVFLEKTGRLPPIKVYTTSMNLRLALLASGNYISCIPSSTYQYGAQGRPLKALPVDMGLKLPMAIFTLKNRTLSPVVLLFIESAREVARSMAKAATDTGRSD
jgi:DNA-binding transcriptional LysR family regulator